MKELPKLTEQDINEIVYEYYGFTINEIDHSVGYWCTRFTEERTKRKQLEHNWNELKKWLEEEIYNIEPKGTAINYNCEYDSEEDYINAMKERSKLITLKRVSIMLQSLEEGGNNEH